MGTLWAALEGLPDHRTKKGRRYELAPIVMFSLAAMLSGANNLRAIFRWGRRLSPKGLAMLGIERGQAPCHSTYHYVFQSLSAGDLERALGVLVDPGPLGHIAIDGKRLRGSQRETSPGVHLLQASRAGCRQTIGSLAVAPDSGEVVEAFKLLEGLPLDGAIITGDAAFTFAPLAAGIRDEGGHYFLFVKGNQPELEAELLHAFGDDSPSRIAGRPGQGSERIDPLDLTRYQETNPGHGRIETRMIALRTKLPARLDTIWPGLAQIARIERRREFKTLCQRQVIYAITSLPPESHGPAQLLALSRDHWQIKNRPFHVRDVTFGEDACRVGTGTAPQVLAHLRDASFTLIRRRNLKPRLAREAFCRKSKSRDQGGHPYMN